jgi:hypothetical protein
MSYTQVNKPASTTYSGVSRDIVNYPQYGVAIYGTSKYGRQSPYTSSAKPVSTTYSQVAKPT